MYNSIQRMADALVDEFVLKGLMRRERNTTKLHLTVMNSKMRQNQKTQTAAATDNNRGPRAAGNDNGAKVPRIPFDACKILEVGSLCSILVCRTG